MAGSSSGAVFQWGNKLPGTDCSYESMCYKGVWYNLYDCVFCRSPVKKPFVGKLMRLFEDEGVKKVRIRWFFRRDELPASVRKDLTNEVETMKQLFIALGGATGVENENVVEVICGKAIVLCTVRCGENPVPSEVHVNDAHHIFNRAYDVSKKKLVRLANVENKHLVRKFYNKQEWLPTVENLHLEDQKSSIMEDCKSSTSMEASSSNGKKRSLSRTSSFESIEIQDKKMKGKLIYY